MRELTTSASDPREIPLVRIIALPLLYQATSTVRTVATQRISTSKTKVETMMVSASWLSSASIQAEKCS
jgi:hypothetical protein